MSDVLVFSAEWCGNCPAVKRALESAGVGHTVVDIDHQMEYAVDHNIRGIPTVIHKDPSGWKVFTGHAKIPEMISYFKDLGLTTTT